MLFNGWKVIICYNFEGSLYYLDFKYQLCYNSKYTHSLMLLNADYLKKQEIPMVIVSHDRQFLDNLCTKIVETERGVSATYKGMHI